MKNQLKRFKWNHKVSISIAVFVVIFGLLSSPLSVFAVDTPTPLTPADLLVTTVVNHPPLGIPEFTWTEVSGATRYRIQFSQDIGFATKFEFTTPNTAYTPINSSQFPDGVWYWRVRVDAPVPGSYSSTMQFEKEWASATNKPLLTSPANGADIEFYDEPVFTWEHVVGAASYRLEIDTSTDFTDPVYEKNYILAPSHQPLTKLANGSYFWRVIPIDPNNRDGTPSDVRSFDLIYGLASQGSSLIPNLISPEDNSNPVFTPTFHWEAVRGAQYYRLQYSTDNTFNTGVTTVDSKNTTYTPNNPLPNDVNYYWRVRAHSGSSVSDWSDVYKFRKQWYIQAELLTPTNNFQNVRFPVFSWTPVPGASYYKVELNTENNFPAPEVGTTANPFWFPNNYNGGQDTLYWRVTPFDKNNNQGLPSEVFSYQSYYTSTAPSQIYPLFYYPPNDYPVPFSDVEMNPYEDRTASLPVFMWQKVYTGTFESGQGETFAGAYRLQVGYFDWLGFWQVQWQVDTENLSAVPKTGADFAPVVDTDYYWRVRPLDQIGGTEIGSWSQTWLAHFDLSQGLDATLGGAPDLLRPEEGYEFAEMTPLFEWFPLDGADAYTIEISTDPGFANGYTIDEQMVEYPAYSPINVYAQWKLDRLDYGTYYWRVHGINGGTPIGSWSDTGRFSIAAQSQWRYERTVGDVDNRLRISQDPGGDVASQYDLTDLYASQSKDYWYIGFNAPSTSSTVLYVLYLDVDHVDGSGATSDKVGLDVSTISTHQPEYEILIVPNGSGFSAGQVIIYEWDGDSWSSVPAYLDSSGGDLYFDGSYVELEIPNTAIGMSEETGSYAISLFALPNAGPGSSPEDSVPSDPNLPGSGQISRFASVTEKLNQRMPPNAGGVDPTVFPSVQPFFWDWPLLAPWSGSYSYVYLDPEFTTDVADYTQTTSDSYFGHSVHPWADDFSGDNTYYWRLRPRYRNGGELLSGAWSQGMSFVRQGFVPQNLQESVSFATPTFSWDMVEGAESYDIQVDDDPNFNSLAINKNTTQPSYTDTGTLNNGNYYWRVRAIRDGSVYNEWSAVQNFVLTLPQPTNLSPDGIIVGRAPTFCWDAVVASSGGKDVFAAWKYKIEVSKNPTFSPIFENAETEQACWTPSKGYDDGTYYWRVAVMDGQGKLGDYSDVVEFVKQYPVTTLVSPIGDDTVVGTPTFVWTAVDGAARYKLEVSKFSNFSVIYDSVITNNIRYTPTKLYDSDTTYYWRVAIIDRDSKIGPFNDAEIILGDAFILIYMPLVVK